MGTRAAGAAGLRYSLPVTVVVLLAALIPEVNPSKAWEWVLRHHR